MEKIGEKSPFSASLCLHQRQMIRQGIRRILVISGDSRWCQQQALILAQLLPGDWPWIGEAGSAQTKIIPTYAAKTLLGQEKMHAIFDATTAFDVEALAVLAGTLRAGSWLLLLVPKWSHWPMLIDQDSRRWCGQEQAIATPHFIYHFQRQLLADNEVAFWHQGHCPILPLTESRPPRRGIDGMPTSKQQAILDRLMRAESGVWVLMAARGRGKSTLAGMLVTQWPGTCWVTARSKSATQILYQQVTKKAVFWAPDALLIFCRQHEVSQVDWLIIDEAAALPGSLLSALLAYFPRILLITTVQGYEGTGQGFLLKFCARLKHCQYLTLTDPIRWAANDPLERVLDHALLLNNPSKSKTGDEKREQGSLKIIRIAQNEAWQKSHLLRDFYGLLSNAHYRTTPLDLRRLMDAPGMHFAAMLADETLVAAIWLVNEGGLEETLARDVWAGRRRPRGNLVAQSLSAHSGQWLAPILRSRRISRIAVMDKWRRRGIALRMVLAEKQTAQRLDFLSVSFGYTDELSAFWHACGFKLVRIGSHKEASSGCYTAMAILPLSTAAKTLCQSLQQQWVRDRIWLPQWQCYPLPINKIEDRSLNDEDWRELTGFAYAFRPLEASRAALQRLLINSLLPLPALRQYLQQQLPIAEIIIHCHLNGRKALTSCWRQEVQQALLNLDKSRHDVWRKWVME